MAGQTTALRSAAPTGRPQLEARETVAVLEEACERGVDSAAPSAGSLLRQRGNRPSRPLRVRARLVCARRPEVPARSRHMAKSFDLSATRAWAVVEFTWSVLIIARSSAETCALCRARVLRDSTFGAYGDAARRLCLGGHRLSRLTSQPRCPYVQKGAPQNRPIRGMP